MHKMREFKERYPLKYHFNLLKCGAKRRGKPVLLTFDEYQKLARESGYDEKRGKEANSLTLDRIDSEGPYSIDNLRVSTQSENSTKNNKKMFVPYFQGLSESDKAGEGGEWTELPTDPNVPF